MFIAAIFIITKTWKQPRCPSTDIWIKMCYIYTIECYSAVKMNTFEWIQMRWMSQEPIIQSEVSQKEKDKYCTSTHIYMESRKTVLMNLFAGKQLKGRHREQTFVHNEGERRWDDLREWHWNIYNTICKVDSHWEFSIWHRKLKAGVLWQPRGVGQRGRREA